MKGMINKIKIPYDKTDQEPPYHNGVESVRCTEEIEILYCLRDLELVLVIYMNINSVTILQISMIPFVYAVPMSSKLPNTTCCTALTFAYIEMTYLITSIVMD